MPATIKDVARAAKVSKATVSYVINDKPGVGEETRRRVLAIMKEMNYRPNAVARGLAGQSTETLGLIIPDISDMFYASIIRGVENTANRFGRTLNLCTTHGLPERERAAVDIYTRHRVDGVILMTYFLEDHCLADLADRALPFVTIDNPAPGTTFPAVAVDNEEAGYQATRHLRELNHRRIAFISGKQGSKDSELRFAGYQRVLREDGLPIEQRMIRSGGFSRDEGYKAAAELLAMADSPTAIFAANDQMALGALSAALDRGLSVPRDLSIIGVDDIEAAAMVEPPLTTIRQPTYEMGGLAVEMLMALIKGERPIQTKVLLKTELIRRGSCAPPGRKHGT
ncbi:MAG: LacI family DNA-binding transcriptional regulator [Bacteroidota bacterium]